MSLFEQGYISLSHNIYLGVNDKYNEVLYSDTKSIKGVIYGYKRVNRSMEETSVSNNFICQTTADVKEKDKINGMIVTDINKHYDLFGKFEYNELSLKNE